MFSGIIEDIGQVKYTSKNREVISIETSFSNIKMGESISCAGVCLTVSRIEGQVFFSDLSPETLEKTTLSKMKRKLAPKKYDLIILFRFLHRPLFKIIPLLMKKNGLFFCETYMIQNGKGKLNTKKNMLLEKELFNLKNCKLNLLKFYQGKDLQKGNIIQTAIFKKV